jgi:hypothetical protein
MAGKLYNLASFVEKLMPTGGKGRKRRLAFNDTPDQELATAGVSGRSLQAFLAFEKGEVAVAALEEVQAQGAIPDDLKKYSGWLSKFATWRFPPGEEKIYKGILPPAALVQLYGNPDTNIYGVVRTGASPNLKLEVYVQGALNGCKVRILDNATSQSVLELAQNPDQGSTFRYGRITLNNVNLANGTYRAAVVNNLGGGVSMVIDTPGKTFVVN